MPRGQTFEIGDVQQYSGRGGTGSSAFSRLQEQHEFDILIV